MQKIQKTQAPASFQQYCNESEVKTYLDFSEHADNKDAFFDFRRHLIEEQISLCAYCQQKIDLKKGKPQKMKTEHFLPKDKDLFPEQQLDYSNLIAVCMGNSDSKKENHCDTSKGNSVLSAIQNPTSSNFRPLFKYNIRPRQNEVLVLPINNQNEELKKDIEVILNLNEETLRFKRFSVFNHVFRKYGIRFEGPIPWNKKNERAIREIIKDCSDKEKKHEFSGFIYDFLNKRFKNELNAK